MEYVCGLDILKATERWIPNSHGYQLRQVGGTHELTLIRKSDNPLSWPLHCESDACITLVWQQRTPGQRTQFAAVFDWKTRILYRGRWTKTLAEWERLVHTLDVQEGEEFYLAVEQLALK
jgi:hypothetical protein